MDLQGLQQGQQQTGHIPQGQPQQGQDLQSLQGGGADPRQLMAMLAQNPTPQMAQQIAQVLQGLGNPDAAQFAQQLMQVANDPESLKQMADMVMQKLSGQ